MWRRILKATFFTLMTLAILAALGIGVVFWRLSQGPVSMAFLNEGIEKAINKQLNGFSIDLEEAVLELDPDTRIPSVRTRNLVLKDGNGDTLARTPKAGVTLDAQALLRGEIIVRSLELIGPKVNIRRNLDGTLGLGIGGSAADADEETIVSEGELGNDPPASAGGAAPPPAGAVGKRLLDLLGVGESKSGTLAKLDDIRVTRAELTLFDEANGATWYAPRADLAFKRMDYGFLVVAKTEVASAGTPWKAEIATTYKVAENVYGVNITITDLVPANVAEKVFALSQFAKFKMPFSGHIEMDVTGAGNITSAKGELFAAAGELNLPDYFAKPILIDEGAFRLAYSTESDQLRILDSSIVVDGSRAEISGSVTARRHPDGRLNAFAIDVVAKNVNVDAVGNAKAPVDIDRIEFKGSAFVDNPQVEIEDLVVMSGETGVRMRGNITGGEASAGIQVAGRMRDVDAELLKQIWPPVLTPKTRAWISDNIIEGRITEGTFQVNFPVNALAKMLKDRVMPKGAVDVSFSMEGVKSRYFKSLPPLVKASGKARLVDETFTLNIDRGTATLDDGKSVSVAQGSFTASDIMLKEVPGEFEFDVQGSVPAMLAFAAHPDINLGSADLTATPKLEGKARALIGLKFPLIKGVPKDRVKVTTKVTVEDVSIADVSPGIDLTDGKFEIGVTKDDITVSGPAKLNGVLSKVIWQKPRGKGSATTALETVVDAKMREKLGLKLDDYMSGSVPVRMSLGALESGKREIDIEADLSSVAMKLAAAGWSRLATKGTKATFTVIDNGKGGRKISDIKLDGPGLRIRGAVSLKDKTIESIKLTEIKLEEDDIFTANLYPGDGVMNLELTGTSIDARPYIKNILSPAKDAAQAVSDAPKGQNFIVSAKFKRVIAYRGESISSVEASIVTQKGQIKTARIEGIFESGKPLTILLTPTEEGRQLKVATIDGGAVLRATNFYSKVAGGQLEFTAIIANRPGSPIRNGLLQIRNFVVRNEAALAELDERGKPKKSGPRAGGVTFKRLEVPFTTDAQFVRLCKVSLTGPEMGASASGIVRKRDGALDITGAYFPLHGLNRALGQIPLFGDILAGGKREGIVGITYAMGGTMAEPKYQVNPFSLILPGFLRKIAEYEQTACRKVAPKAANN